MTNDFRILTPAEIKQVSAVAKKLVLAIGGVEAAAGFSRVSHQSMQRYGDLNLATVHMPLDVAIELEGVAEKPVIAQFMAARLGYGIFKLPNADLAQKDWRNFANLMARVNEVMKDVADSLADDNQISASEIIAKDLIADFDALLVSILTLRADCIEKVDNDE